MDNYNERILDKIIDKLQNYTTDYEKKYFNRKLGWNNFGAIDSDKIKTLASTVIAAIKVELPYMPATRSRHQKTKRSEFTIECDNFGKIKCVPGAEDTLERLITCFSNSTIENCRNQVNIGGGSKSAIDIEYTVLDRVYLVELKQWKVDINPPTYALVEILKNYFAYKKNVSTEKIVEKLIILAPKAYYINFGDNNKSIERFFCLIREIEAAIKTSIELRYFDLDKKDFIMCLKNAAKQGITKINSQNINTIAALTPLKEKLKFGNWHSISNADGWLDLKSKKFLITLYSPVFEADKIFALKEVFEHQLAS